MSGPSSSQAGPADRPTVRVALYSPDSYGLGHARRTVNIARALIGRHPQCSALAISGSSKLDLFEHPARFDTVKMPSVTKAIDGSYVSRKLSLSLDDVVGIRSQVALAAVQRYRPDVLLVDHAPRGFLGELDTPLAWLRDHVPHCQIVLGLREILDEPARARHQLARDHFVDIVRDRYNAIMIYGDPDLFDAVQEYRLPEDIASKVSYTGMVVAQDARQASRPRPVALDQPHILICAGGGGDGYPFLRASIRAAGQFLRAHGGSIKAVTGPFLSPSKFARLRQLAGKDIDLSDSVAELPRLLDAADLIVCMGGYNTLYEALAARRRVIAVPRTHPRLEQWERASRLRDLGALEVLTLEEARGDGALVEAMDRALRKPPATLSLSFAGAAHAADRLIELSASVGRRFPRPASSDGAGG